MSKKFTVMALMAMLFLVQGARADDPARRYPAAKSTPPSAPFVTPEDEAPASAPGRAWAYLDVGVGGGGFWATAEGTAIRRFRGYSPFGFSSRFGIGGGGAVIGVGLHHTRVDGVTADRRFDSNGNELGNPEDMQFALTTLGLFGQFRLRQLRELGFTVGIASSDLTTDRGGDLEEPEGLAGFGEVSYDFDLGQRVGAGPWVRFTYHDLSVDETGGGETAVGVIEPSLGLAIRIIPD